MAEDFGVQGRGAFYDQTGTIRDVIQNHLFQVLCNLAMEAPVRLDSESVRDEKVKVLKAIRRWKRQILFEGSFAAICKRRELPRTSKMETFAALRLEVNSWRWQGVPVLHQGREVPSVTCTESFAGYESPHFYSCGVSQFEYYTAVPDQPGCGNRHGHDGFGSG